MLYYFIVLTYLSGSITRIMNIKKIAYDAINTNKQKNNPPALCQYIGLNR